MKCPILSIGKQPGEFVECIRKYCQLWTGIMMRPTRNEKVPRFDCALVINAIKGEDGIAKTLPTVERTP